MPKSGETNSSKCFSAVLSRLLCSGGLPTHPSEQLIEPSTAKLEYRKPLEAEENATRGSNPGVVARLMGLEYFPAAVQIQRERTLGDYFRSRSVNSIDFLSHFDPVVKPRNQRHRRVRTSVSFREGLSDDFASVVLLLEEEFQAKIEEEKREKNRKVSGKNVEIQEKRKLVYEKNVEIKEKRNSDYGNSELKKKDLQGTRRADLKERRPVMKGVKCEKELMGLKKKKSKTLAHKLSFDFKKIHPQEAAPEVARIASPRKHQPSQIVNSQPQSLWSNASLAECVIIAEKNEGRMQIDENFCYKKMVEGNMLTEESVRENWIYGMDQLKFDNFEEICQQFGQEILEGLLAQFVDELFLLFGKEIMIN